MDFVTILLIIVALGLVGAYAYIKVRERREDDLGEGAPTRPAPPRSTSVAVDDLTDLDEEDEEEVDVLDDRPSTSSWLEEIAVRDDDALAGLEALADTDAPELEELDEPAAEAVPAEAYDLDTTTVDEEFESLTADLEVEVEAESPVIVKEEVETADDIMANSKATEINPAGNTELQNLLQKVQARLSQYE